MSCPRCGYPEAIDRCELCGQTDFNQYEMARYRGEAISRFEMTLNFPDSVTFAASAGELKKYTRFKKTDGWAPRFFVFFPDGQTEKLIPFLATLRCLSGWELLVNGRPRPYLEELWLPLLDLLHVPGGGE